MNCPYHKTEKLPDTDKCRQNRKAYMATQGMFCRPCASCGRDIGPKKKKRGRPRKVTA